MGTLQNRLLFVSLEATFGASAAYSVVRSLECEDLGGWLESDLALHSNTTIEPRDTSSLMPHLNATSTHICSFAPFRSYAFL